MSIRQQDHDAAKVLRSLLVGGAATALDLGMLALLITGMGTAPRLANAPALIAGVGLQFVGNKLFAFRDGSSRWVAQGAQFLAVEALAFVLNLAIFDVLVRWGLPFVAARLLGSSVVYLAVCLPLWSQIFRTPKPEECS